MKKLHKILVKELIERQHKMIIEKVPIEAKTILDLGCATGQDLDYYKNIMNMKTYGVEINLSRVKIACSKGHKVKNSNIDSLSIIDFGIKFDVIVAKDSLEHVKEPLKTLQQIEKLLKDSGLLIIGLPLDKECNKYGKYAGNNPEHQWKATEKEAINYVSRFFKIINQERDNGQENYFHGEWLVIVACKKQNE